MVLVRNMATLATQTYSCSPREAVMAAYAQERGDNNTWDYERRYGGLLTVGQTTVCCGDWCGFLDGRETGENAPDDQPTGPPTL